MISAYGILQLKEFVEAHSKNQSNPAAAAAAAAVVNSLKVFRIVYFWLYLCFNYHTTLLGSDSVFRQSSFRRCACACCGPHTNYSIRT